MRRKVANRNENKTATADVAMCLLICFLASRHTKQVVDVLTEHNRWEIGIVETTWSVAFPDSIFGSSTCRCQGETHAGPIMRKYDSLRTAMLGYRWLGRARCC